MQNQLMKIEGSKKANRKSRSAKAMAVLSGGVLAVIAAVRVTTASEMATTQAAATQASTTQEANASTMPTTVPSLAFAATQDSATTAPSLAMGDMPATQPSDALSINDSPSDELLKRFMPSDASVSDSHARVINVQYNPQNSNGPVLPPTGIDSGVATPGDAPAASPAAQTNAPANANIVSDGVKDGRVQIAIGKSAVINTKFPYKRISIGDPTTADVNAIGSGSLLVTGKKAGTTQLILWDDAERSQVIDIEVVFDLRALQDQLKEMFPGSTIQVTSLSGAVALRGRVPDAKTASDAVVVATPFGQKVLNFLEIGGGQQVQLQVRFAEVSRTAINSLGVNLGFTDGTGLFGSNIGQTNPLGFVGTSAGSDLSVTSPAANVTQFGRIALGGTAVDVFVEALRENNLLRVLAEPNIVAISGQNASFLAGGEFPIPVTQGSSTGGATVTIEYREYGVRLNFVPVVLGNGKIRLKVAPEVSDLDYTNAVKLNGFSVPGLSTRKVETTVEMQEGQTFAIAGLLKNNQTSSKQVTPLVGDLPVIGALFRSVRFERDETELVVMVTPKIVEPMNPDKVPALPGEHWRDPSEVDLYWNRDLGGDATATTRPSTDNRPAAKYHGHYGYVPATNQTASAE